MDKRIVFIRHIENSIVCMPIVAIVVFVVLLGFKVQGSRLVLISYGVGHVCHVIIIV